MPLLCNIQYGFMQPRPTDTNQVSKAVQKVYVYVEKSVVIFNGLLLMGGI